MPRITFGSFSLEASGDWTLSTVILAGPVDESPKEGLLTTKGVRPFQRNLVATMEEIEAGTTLEAYVKRQIDGLKAAGVSRQDAGKPERIKLGNGLDGLITEQIIVGGTGERVRQMQLVCIKSGVAHTIIASHLDGGPFEGARKSFRAMLVSFS
jgi:hypothetical protein